MKTECWSLQEVQKKCAIPFVGEANIVFSKTSSEQTFEIFKTTGLFSNHRNGCVCCSSTVNNKTSVAKNLF